MSRPERKMYIGVAISAQTPTCDIAKFRLNNFPHARREKQTRQLITRVKKPSTANAIKPNITPCITPASLAGGSCSIVYTPTTSRINPITSPVCTNPKAAFLMLNMCVSAIVMVYRISVSIRGCTFKLIVHSYRCSV